ncbi:RICIN domain-containing protein [Actinomadura decatromicini]|uniref:Ricin-type beta-trefoil lectin domain protein n=1 Tax=Actinomadura decatromicini TaxID=2604572 RepID=A0A5D3F9M5_9ACTN|nr:RICIN domain-containing protein [Actinomadura decatromicini]TYK44380.1 ricin-type beta-trefoil lectin domain protein [Actinomadura decatromicini]
MRNRLIHALAALCVPALLTSTPLAASAAQPATGKPAKAEVQAGYVTMWAWLGNTDRCIDVPGWSTQKSTKLHTWDCLPTQANELFTAEGPYTNNPGGYAAYLLRNKHSGMCINVPNKNKTPGVQLIQYPCNPNEANSQWVDMRTRSIHVFKNAYTNLCMAVEGGGTANGTKLIQWHCDETQAYEKFYLGG